MRAHIFSVGERVARRGSAVVAAHPMWVVLLGLVLALGVGLGVFRLTLENDYRLFFDKTAPELVAFEQLEQAFSGGDNVTLVVETGQAAIGNAQGLAALNALTRAAWRLPYVVRVDSLANYHYSWRQEGSLMVAPFFSAEAAAAEQGGVFQRHQAALADPAVRGRLISDDGRAAQVLVTLALPKGDMVAVAQVAAAAAQIQARWRAEYPQGNLWLGGTALLSQSFIDVIYADMIRLIPALVVLLMVLMAVLLRSWVATLAAMISMGLAILTTMGIAGWLGMALSPASAQTPVIILTIATAEGIHLIGAMQERRRQGMARSEAVRGAVSVNHAPIFVTTLTDILGFLTFNFSETPPFRDLGNLAALGALVAYGFSMLFLPALLRLIPLAPTVAPRFAARPLTGVVTWALRARRWVVGVFILLVLVSAVQLPKLEVRDTFLEWLGPEQPFRQDAEATMTRLPGTFLLFMEVPAEGAADEREGGVADPAYLARLATFVTWLRAQPEVAHVFSLSDIMRRLHQDLGEKADSPGLPRTREEAAQYLLVYEMSLAQGQEMTDLVTLDKASSRVVVTLNMSSSEQIMALKQRLEAQMRTLHGPKIEALGPAVLFSKLSHENAQAMLGGAAASFLSIALVTGLAVGAWRLGLISMVVAMVPVLLTFGLWRWIEGAQGLYAAFVVSCALGLAVDAVTHVVMGVAAARRHAPNMATAIQRAYGHLGPELAVASVILCLGFGVLTFSSFAVMAKLAQMTMLIFAIALVTTFVLGPALLRLWGERDRH